VLAGNPFGIEERHGAGFGGHGHLHVEEAPRGVGGVHLQLDRRLRVQRQESSEKSNGGESHSFDSSNAMSEARALVVACTGMMTLSALLSLGSSGARCRRRRRCIEDFRAYYTVEPDHGLHQPLDDALRRRDDRADAALRPALCFAAPRTVAR
jgi:hypothetical protein